MSRSVKLMTWPYAVFVALLMVATPTLTQPDALRGTWAGGWLPEDGDRACTVRFVREEDRLSGEMLNPEHLSFNTVSFDPERLTVVAEAESREHGQITLEARIEEETRLNGTLIVGDDAGPLALTKWTYQP